jgi:Mce-associated membrane protein
VSEQTPPGSDQPQPPDTQDVDRIARLRARASQPDATPPEASAAPPEGTAGTELPTVEPPTVELTKTEPHATTPTPVPLPAPPAAADAPRRRSRVAVPALAVVVVLAVVAAATVALAGLVAARVSSANAVDGTRGDVVGAATSGVATVLSYDYRHLDTDFARARGLLTPKFRKQYDDTTAKGVRPLAAKYKAISSADVSAAGVVEAGRDRAVVLVFVNQTVTNSQLTAPRLDRSRIKVSLVRSQGRWLIDKLTTL